MLLAQIRQSRDNTLQVLREELLKVFTSYANDPEMKEYQLSEADFNECLYEIAQTSNSPLILDIAETVAKVEQEKLEEALVYRLYRSACDESKLVWKQERLELEALKYQARLAKLTKT